MQSYLGLVKRIMDEGQWKENRTGIKTLSTFGLLWEHDMTSGFPLLTTKKMATRAIIGELIGFLRGYDNAAQFRELGCNVWNQNANENQQWLNNPHRKGEDDLGRIYGVQWNDFFGVNQLDNLVDKLHNDPTDRRMIVTAINPADQDAMCLPPCHILFQCYANPATRELSLGMYQRSCDFFLGVPFDIASYGFLLSLLAHHCGYTPRYLKIMFGDSHIYENHMEQMKIQLDRAPLSLPMLAIPVKRDRLQDYCPEDFVLTGYESYGKLTGEMAV